MAKELPFDETPTRREFITPGDDGSVLIRTQYRGTDDVLNRNAQDRGAAPASFIQKGVTFYKAASIPLEVYEQMTLKLGRTPTAQELLELSRSRDYAKLRSTDRKL